MKPNLDLAERGLERNFSAVTSPLSPSSMAPRYPMMMEPNESFCRRKMATDWQGTWEKSLSWQQSPEGRDFMLPVKDKDEHNLEIQRLLIIENLEQCTEDHDRDQMNRGLANENQCHEESDYEETEHKLFLAGGMFPNYLHSEEDHNAPEIGEKSDVEKEKGEKDGVEKEYYEKNGEEEKMNENELTNKDGDEKEVDDKEKSENEEAEKKVKTKKIDQNSWDKVNAVEHYFRADMAAGETVNDSGFFEVEVPAVNPEGQLEPIDRFGVIETEVLEVKEVAIVGDPLQQMEHEPVQIEMKERSAVLVLTLDSCPEDLDFDAEVFGYADSPVPGFLTNNSSLTGVSPLPVEEELTGSCMDSDIIRKEESQRQLEGVLIANGAEMVPSNVQPMSLHSIEQKWKNISNSTISRIGREPVNSEQYRGGSGDRSGKSSQGSCGNGGGGGASQHGACGGGGEGYLSMAGTPSNGGLGSGCGGGDEDGDKWKKEDFRFSDSADEKKTKQEKELKKKSRLEKGDLCSYNAVVSYGSKEALTTMALKWGERSEHIRHNSAFARHHSEGIILESYKNEFFINENGYQEDLDWAKATGNFSPLGCATGTEWNFSDDGRVISPRHGTSGKCYPCADVKTGNIFCVKEIQLSNFYGSEIAILLDLDNPGIVKLYGAIFSDDKVYILQELICGPTLQEEIDKNEKLDCLTALECMRQLLEVLDYLERCGVIHDDVKADNIMFREGSNSIVLIDFGLAKKASQVQEGAIPCGSECGMSPEKAASEGYNAKADIWAATAVLVHMLSGNVPWTVRFKNKAHLYLIIKERSPPLEDMPPDTPQAIQSLIETGWIVDAHRRPSASQLLTCEAFQLLDASLPSDELRDEFYSIDEHTNLGNFDLEDGEKLIMEAEEMLAKLETGAANFDHETLDNLEGAASTDETLHGLFE